MLVAGAAAFAIGAFLRLDQFAAQVLLDDEWHAVHQVMTRSPSAFIADFGHADYGIPIALYDWVLVHTIGLSETAMRMPMMVAGLATIVLLPLAVARRVGHEAALALAFLLALSPPLVAYSQIARPYAITLLVGWYAHWAFQRAWRGSRADAVGYVVATAFACWLHLVIAPFVLAPFAWAAWTLWRDPAARRTQGRRVAALAVATAIALAALVGPPLLARPEALGAKGGFTAFGPDTLAGAVHWWLGSRWVAVVALALLVAALGAPKVWRALPEARTGTLGLAGTAIALAFTRPEWGETAFVFARYLLPFVPLLLLAIACGAVAAGERFAAGPRRTSTTVAVAAVVTIALAVSSPLRAWTRHPNSNRLGIDALYDFRPGPNRARETISRIPMSPFWQSLATHPPGTLVVAAAPFRFESYDWDAPRWERKSGQRVIPGWLTGLCVERRTGELPATAGHAFRNAAYLADRASLDARRVDYVVWQKPWVAHAEDRLVRGGDDTAACEPALRARFGAPVHEDAQLVAFRVAAGGPDARR